jgi:hypothetical protein
MHAFAMHPDEVPHSSTRKIFIHCAPNARSFFDFFVMVQRDASAKLGVMTPRTDH